MTPKDIINNYNGVPDTLNIPDIIKLFTDSYPSLATRGKNLSIFKRKLLEKTPINGYSSAYEYNVIMMKSKQKPLLLGKLADIRLPREESKTLTLHQKKRHEERVIHQNNISSDNVEKLISMLKSDNITEVMIGFAVCTGRRSTEVTKTGIFKKIKNDTNHVKFQGILKDFLNKNKTFTIPIIGDSTHILKAYRRIRKEVDASGLDNDQAIKIYGDRMLKRIKKFDKSMTIHSLRSIYVSYLYQYKNTENHSKTHMIQHYLCHDGQECTVNYNNWIIDEPQEEEDLR
jgi:integrase